LKPSPRRHSAIRQTRGHRQLQPLHSYPDSNTLDVWARNAGPDRASRAWAWKASLMEEAAWPSAAIGPSLRSNPWEGIQSAVTRQTSEGKPEGGFVPEQRLTVAQAIEGYTLGAAFCRPPRKNEGSVEIGKLADLIILSQNIFDIKPNRIGATKVVTTNLWVGG